MQVWCLQSSLHNCQAEKTASTAHDPRTYNKDRRNDTKTAFCSCDLVDRISFNYAANFEDTTLVVELTDGWLIAIRGAAFAKKPDLL